MMEKGSEMWQHEKNLMSCWYFWDIGDLQKEHRKVYGDEGGLQPPKTETETSALYYI